MKKIYLKLIILILMCLCAKLQVFAVSDYNNEDGVNKVPDIIKYKYKYNKVPLKQPQITPEMIPAIEEYKQGNYLGAMVDFKEILKKDRNNVYVKYYLALCYTQLGYKSEAGTLYNEVAESQDNYALAHYSKLASVCLENPDSEECYPVKPVTPPKPKVEETVQEVVQEPMNNEPETDIEKFIKSGKKIHPAAMDKIVNERMIRKMQSDAYSAKQAEEAENNPDNNGAVRRRRVDTSKKSDASMPTNEEIVAALDTLSKIGLNPLTQLNSFNALNTPIAAVSQFGLNDSFFNPMTSAILSNGQTDVSKMLLYAQMMQQENNILNYGI